jgi:hypothetical protein
MRSRCCLCVCLCIPSIVARQRLGKNPRIVARQRLGRNVTAVTNIYAKTEELLDALFSMWAVPYQGKKAISSSQNFLLFFRPEDGGEMLLRNVDCLSTDYTALYAKDIIQYLSDVKLWI